MCSGVFQNAVSKGVRNISFGDLSENLGLTMYGQLSFKRNLVISVCDVTSQ